MLKKCECGKEFLTEADPHIVLPYPHKELGFNCGCYFKKQTIRKILHEISIHTACYIKCSEVYKDRKSVWCRRCKIVDTIKTIRDDLTKTGD